MTGWANGFLYLSKVTRSSFEDLGCDVNYLTTCPCQSHPLRSCSACV